MQGCATHAVATAQTRSMRGRPLGEVVFVRARRNIVLEVELDIFSGVPNPTWVLSQRHEATLYERLKADPKQISSATSLNTRLGLGYRGLVVRRIKTDNGPWDKALAARRSPFPNEFRLGIGASKKNSAADWLANTAGPQGVELNDQVQEVVSHGVMLVPRLRGPLDPKEKVDP